MAKKANGKAKEVRKYDVSLVPVNGMWKLTPERAMKWLDYEYEGFQTLATAGLRHAKHEEDRGTFELLAHSVKTMVEACLEALSGESSVVVFSDVGAGPYDDGTYSFGRLQRTLRLLHILSLMRHDIDIRGWSDSEFDAIDALIRIVERYVKAASKVESKAFEEDIRRRAAERQTSRPHVRLGVVLDCREALEAERDAAVSDALDTQEAELKKVAEPWNRRLDYLEYEQALLLNDLTGCSAVHPHPGKPPEGYEPQTMGNA
jgi:hypothetical protein